MLIFHDSSLAPDILTNAFLLFPGQQPQIQEKGLFQGINRTQQVGNQHPSDGIQYYIEMLIKKINRLISKLRDPNRYKP